MTSSPSVKIQQYDDESQHAEDIELYRGNQQQASVSFAMQSGISKLTKSKTFKLLIAFILIAAFGVIWFEDFQTYQKRPLNKAGNDVPPMPQQSFQIDIQKAQKQTEKKPISEEQEIWNQCYKQDIMNRYIFYISFDFDDMPKEQVDKFQRMNNICKFQINNELSFDYFVDLWNQREEQVRFDQAYINKTALTKEQKRLLFIWLKLYFKAGIYIHPSLGVNFGRYINERYLLNAQVAKEILFARVDHKNEKGIFVPERNFKTVKVGKIFSEYIRKIILKIVAKEDWMEICEKYQCIIIKDALKYPSEL